MANPQHIEWLLEGVEAWNARREREEFVPDFRGLDFDNVMERSQSKISLVPQGGKITRVETPILNFKNIDLRRADLRGARMTGSMFDNAKLNGALLQKANLFQSTFRRTTLTNAILTETEFGNCHFMSASLGQCDAQEARFDNARISGSYFGGSDFTKAIFADARMRGTDFSSSLLNQADFTDADVQSYLSQGRPREVLCTDISHAKNLTQSQLDSMLGDSETILPDHLKRPAHWPEFEFPEEPEESDPTSETAAALTNPAPSPQNIPRATIAVRLQTEAPVIALTSASLLEQIANYREHIRGDNILAAEHTGFRNGLLDFLDTLHIDLKSLLTTLPAPGDTPTPAEVEKTATWTERFIGSAIPEWQKYLAAEALGKASAPAGIILTCGALGAALTGFNPLGFGAGSVVGKWITGELKTGAATDKLAKQMKPDTPEPDSAEQSPPPP